jgi:hypothetical protein
MGEPVSGVQRFFMRLFPRRWAADMETESRRWRVQCPHCGLERSVWEMGGIRWRAAGNPRWLLRCPQCGMRKWHRVYYRKPV